MKKLNLFFFRVLKVLNERIKLFLNISKERAKWIIKSVLKGILFLKKKTQKFSNSLFLFIIKLKKKDEFSESKKDSPIYKNNAKISGSTIPIQSKNWVNFSLTEKKIKDMNAKTKTILKEIEKNTKEEKKKWLRISKINIQKKKKTYDVKTLEFKKNILHILQRKKDRLTSKKHYFLKFLTKRI
jgi:hypothetical protein